MIVQVDVQQVDIPGHFRFRQHVRFHNLARDWQGSRLRIVVEIFILRREATRIVFFKQLLEDLYREDVARLVSRVRIVFRQRRPLVNPFPQNAQSNLARGHVFHEIEDVVVAKQVGRL